MQKLYLIKKKEKFKNHNIKISNSAKLNHFCEYFALLKEDSLVQGVFQTLVQLTLAADFKTTDISQKQLPFQNFNRLSIAMNYKCEVFLLFT